MLSSTKFCVTSIFFKFGRRPIFLRFCGLLMSANGLVICLEWLSTWHIFRVARISDPDPDFSPGFRSRISDPDFRPGFPSQFSDPDFQPGFPDFRPGFPNPDGKWKNYFYWVDDQWISNNKQVCSLNRSAGLKILWKELLWEGTGCVGADLFIIF
jgi:hypothetical protein